MRTAFLAESRGGEDARRDTIPWGMTKPAKNKALTAHDVFVPSSFPEHTYVARGGDDLEDKLRFALKTPTSRS